MVTYSERIVTQKVESSSLKQTCKFVKYNEVDSPCSP